MSKYLNTIEYQISTKLDSKGLSQLQSQLREIEATLSKISGSDDVFDFSESIRQVRELNKALTSSFNSSIGMLDLNKFKNELNSANVTAKGLGTAFQHSGAQGKIALTNLLGQIGKIDTGIKRTNATLDKMFNTIGNTVRWGIVSSGFSQVLNSLHQSVDYVKELDDSLTQIMLVTDYSRQQMNEYAKSANEAAKALGSTTVDVTQGSLVFAQQGFDLQQSSQLAEYSIKLANASQQDTATTSDQITALMNAYNLSGDMEELKKALDSWALVANISAADVEELAKASQKAASSASTVGVSLDQMNAQIATIESVTRDAPEQIGNGLKTLYSRLSDISLGETLEDGVDLGKVTTELQKIGVQVLDQAGQMRNVGDIMEDLMVIWDDLDQTSKEAAGQAIAGKYQLNRFYALMDNSDMYRQYKTGSANASGTLDQMNQEFVDSLQGRLNKLQATWEDLFNSLFDTDAVYPFIDVATTAIDLIDKAVDSIGGGLPLLTGLVGVFGKLFSNNIAQNINDTYVNKQLDSVRQANARNVPGLLNQLGFNNSNLIQGSNEFKGIVDFVQQGQSNISYMSEKQIEQYNTILKDVISNTNALVAEQEQFEEAWKAVNMAANAAGRSELVEEQANLEEFLYSLDKDTDFGKYVNKFKQAREEAISLEKSIKDVAESTTYLVNNIGKDAVTDVKFFDKLKNDINLVDDALDDLKATGMLTWKEIDELEKSFEQVAKPIRFMDELTEETTEDVRKFAEQTQVLIKVLTGLKDGKFSSQQLRDYISKWQPNIETKQAAKERSLSEGEALLKGVDRTKQIKTIIDTTSAIGELAFAWQGFQNLGSLWKNEEISTGEKVLQTIINLSMTLPSLITSLKQLKEMGNVFSILGDWGKEKLDKINPRVIGQNKIDSVTSSLDDYLLQSKDKITEKQEAINLEIQEKQQELKAAQEQRNRYLAEKEYNRSSEAKLEVKKNLEGTINPKTGKKWTKSERAGLLSQSQNALTKLAEEESSKIKNLEKDITGLTKQSDKLDVSLGKIRDTSKSVSFNPIKIGISQLGEQFKGFLAANWPMLALTAITTAIGIYQNSLDDARKKATEFYEETKASYDQHQQSISNFETLYQTWKDTGEGAEELKKAGGELSEELNILGGDALVAAEKFDILRSKITSVAEADRNSLINAGNAAIEKNQNYGFLNLFDVERDAKEALNQTNWWKNQEVRDFLAQNNITSTGVNSENAMSRVGEAIDLVSNKLSEMTDTSSETYRQLMDIYNNLNAVYNKEEWANIREAAQSVSEARVETDQFAEKLKGAEDSSEKLWKLFSTDYGTSTYFNNLSSDAERYQFILQNIENEATKADLSIKQTESVLKGKGIDINLADQLQSFSAKQQMEIVATLDTTKSKEAIEIQLQNIIKQINEENSESNQLKLDIEDARERYKDVWEAFQNDEVAGYEQLKDVFGEDIVQAFKDARDQSEALKDAFILLQDATYNTQQAGIDLKATLDDLDHGLKLENLDDIEDKIQEAEERVEDFSKLDPLRNIFGEDSLVGQVLLELDTDKAREEVQSLKDELEDETFNLSVDIGGDLLDQANMAMEALNDISTGLEKVGDDFLVAAEDAVSLENAFPGILENYTVTTEGMIQLDQAKAQSAIAAATSEAEANSKSMVQQLKDYAEYADIMSEQYMLKAELFAKMAETTVMTEDEANAAIAEADKELSETAESNLKEKDLATQQESQNEIDYAKDVGQGVADSLAQGAASGVASISDLSVNFAEAASNMVKNAWEVADAIAQMENGDQGGSTNLQGAQLSMSDKGKSVQVNALSPGETFKINGKEYQVKQGAFGRSSGILASAAQEYQAKALAFQKMAGRARASAAAMEASQMQAANDIANVGIPEAKPEKETKEPTEKEYEPKYKEPIEEEVDLYEKVNTQLDEVQETLQKIQKETDRLIGPKARANMNKQISLLEKEIGLQKEKLSIQEQERADLANELSGRYNIWFDSEGFIDNYAETLKRLEEDVNYYTNRYNQSAEEADQEFYESMIEESQAELDNFKKLYQRYDELQGKEIPQTINQIEELTNSIEDLRIEAYKTAQQTIDDLKELRDKGAELLGLFTEYESDSPFRATIVDAEKLKNIFGGTKQEALDYYQTIIDKNKELMQQTSDPNEQRAYQSAINFFQEQQRNAVNNPLGTGALGLASQDLERLQKWVDNPNAEDNVFAGNDAALYEAYEGAYDRLRELALEAEKNWEQLKDDIIDGYDDIAEREDEQIERYDRISERLETIADIHSIAFGEEMYADISRIYDQIARTTLQQAKDQKTIYQNWVDRYNAIEDKTSDIAKTVRKNMEEAEDKLIELQKSVAESWKKAFENAIKEITAQTNKNLFGSRNLDDFSSDWERDKEFNNRYYDEVQKASRIEQLRLKYMDLLDSAQNSSLDIQRRIRDAMNEQISYLEDQKYLSEYNVKYANAQLEILQKQIALEDARNNKNQMRLRRDTQGNYRYVYSANQDDIRDKEADLLQSQMDAYDMSKQNRTENAQNAFDLYRTTMSQLEALEQRIQQGDEDAVKAKEALLADFERDVKAYSEEIGDSWVGMVESLEWMSKTGSDAVQESVGVALQAIEDGNDELLTELGIKANEVIINQLVNDNIPNLVKAVLKANDEMTQEAIKYEKLIIDEVAPLVTNGFDNVTGAIEGSTKATRELADATVELNEALMGDNAALIEATTQLEDYKKQLMDVKDQSALTAKQLKQAQKELDQTKAQNLNYKTQIDDLREENKRLRNTSYTTISYGLEGEEATPEKETSKTSNNKSQLSRNRVEAVYNLINTGQADVSPARRGIIISKGYSEREAAAGQALINLNYPTWAGGRGMDYEQALKQVLATYDTGGYTGKWNSKEGKLALLHQKELVLNSSDTQNILEAVDMVRNMADMLKVFGNMSIKGTGFNKLGGDTIQQRVEIKAEFPNVQNSNEIEQALLNIADSAYQYSYKTI